MRPLVLSIHGIRTRGAWQKALTTALNRAGFDHHPLDFGFFGALSLVWPGVRRRRLAWFLEQYTAAERDNGRVRPSIIGHSFGTYLITRAMETYPEVCFDNVILCGSIVRQGFPWTLIFDRQQVSRVLHDYGRLDFWAGVAGWVMEDAGPSGKYGFADDAGKRVIQRPHPEFRHSDYFYSLNYEKNWIPFLKGAAPGPISGADKRPVNWRFRMTLAAIVALLPILLSVLARSVSAPSLQSVWKGIEDFVTPKPAAAPPTLKDFEGVWEVRSQSPPHMMKLSLDSSGVLTLTQVGGQPIGRGAPPVFFQNVKTTIDLRYVADNTFSGRTTMVNPDGSRAEFDTKIEMSENRNMLTITDKPVGKDIGPFTAVLFRVRN